MTSSADRDVEPVAIIGAACRFPGDATSLEKFWQLMETSQDLSQRIIPRAFNADGFYHPTPDHSGTTSAINAYFLAANPNEFDHEFFGMTKVEAQAADPQHRQALEVVYEALVEAGLTMASISGSPTSVYSGSMTADHEHIILKDFDTAPKYVATGLSRALLSNRISYFFNLHGPSMTIDTACSSSLVALHQAVQSLRNGESTMSIVTGTNILSSPEMFIGATNLSMLGSAGKTKMWSKDADGYTRGEGIAALILKTLSRSIADNDTIDCLIRATAINQDGRTYGITMPSTQAQESLIRSTYQRAMLSLSSTRYLEAHGTGTDAGGQLFIVASHMTLTFLDIAESSAIRNVFSDFHTQSAPLYVGSVKTIIGHTEGASGLAGVLRVMMALRNRIIPASKASDEQNPAIILDNMRISDQNIPWPANNSDPPRGSINAFGLGGTNAHAVLEAYPPRSRQSVPRILPRIFALSAKSVPALERELRDLADHLSSHPEIDMDDLAYTLNERRDVFTCRTTLLASNLDGLILEARRKARDPQTFLHTVSQPHNQSVLCVFDGQGGQWATMGRELILNDKSFEATIDLCQEYLDCLPEAPTWKLKSELFANEEDTRISEPLVCQALCTAVQLALVCRLRSFGINPGGVVGHSSGEIGAAYCANVLSLRDAMLCAYYRGMHVAKLATLYDGAMMAVELDIEAAELACRNFKNRFCIASINSPSSVTLSGDRSSLLAFQQVLRHEDIATCLLSVPVAYHSHHMASCTQDYLDAMNSAGIRSHPPSILWVSSLTGQQIVDKVPNQYWVENLISRVLFGPALQTACERLRLNSILEVGPHPALRGSILQVLGTKSSYIKCLHLLSRHKNDLEVCMQNIGQLWELGAPVDLRTIGSLSAPTGSAVIRGLPKYPFDHSTDLRIESRLSRRYRQRHYRSELIGCRQPDDFDQEMRWWRVILRSSEIIWLQDHKIQGVVVFPVAGFIAMAIEAISRSMTLEDHPAEILLTGVRVGKALLLSHSGTEVMTTLRYENEDLPSNRRGGSFAIYSCTDTATNHFDLNCSGNIYLDTSSSLPHIGHSRKADEALEQTVNDLYSSLALIGYDYGPHFRRCYSVSCGDRVSRGSIRNFDTTGAQTRHILHPTVLDSALHLVLAALPGFLQHMQPDTFVPTTVQVLKVSTRLLEIDAHAFRVEARTKLACRADCPFEASLEAHIEDDRANTAAFSLYGLRCAKLSNVDRRREVFFTPKHYPAIFDDAALMSQDLSLLTFIKLFTNHYPGTRIAEYVPSDHTVLILPQVRESVGRNFAAFTYLAETLRTAEKLRLAHGLEDEPLACEVLTPLLTKQDLIVVATPLSRLDLADVLFAVLKTGGYLVSLCHLNEAIWSTYSNIKLRYSSPHPDIEFKIYTKVDTTINCLLNPQRNLDQILAPIFIIGGLTHNVVNVVTEIKALLCTAHIVSSILDLPTNLSAHSVIIYLSDLENIILDEEGPPACFDRLLLALQSVGTFVSVSQQSLSANYRQSLLVGLLRAARSEIETLSLITIDFADCNIWEIAAQAAMTISSVAIQTFVAKQSSLQHCLWTEETEFQYSEKTLKIQRIEPRTSLNDRLDARTHIVTKESPLLPYCMYILNMDASYWIKSERLQSNRDSVVISIELMSVSRAMRTFGNIGYGVVIGGPGSNAKVPIGTRVLCLCQGEVSTRLRYSTQDLYLLGPEESPIESLSFVSVYMVAITILESIKKDWPSDTLERCLIITVDDPLGLAAFKLARYYGRNVKAISCKASEDYSEYFCVTSNTSVWDIEALFISSDAYAFVITNTSTFVDDMLCILPSTCMLMDMRDSQRNKNIPRCNPHRLCLVWSKVRWAFEMATRLSYRHDLPIPALKLISIDPLSGGHLSDGAMMIINLDKIVSLLMKVEPPDYATLFRHDRCYVLAGFNGALGVETARFMAQHHARYLAIISRSGVKPSFIENLASYGTEVIDLKCNISDRDRLFSNLDELEKSLPSSVAIGGIANMAMVLHDVPVSRLCYDDLRAVFEPKVRGSQNLHDWSVTKPLDFFIMYSSIAAVFGNRGQAAYAAANRFHVGLNGYRRSLKLVSSVVDLGVVSEVGIVKEKGMLNGALRPWLNHTMSVSDCLHVFAELVLSGKDFSMHDSNLITGFPTRGSMSSQQYWHLEPRFNHLLVNNSVYLKSRLGNSQRPSVPDRLSQKTGLDFLHSTVEKLLLESIADMLQTPAHILDPHRSLVDYGLDSLMAIQVRSFFSRNFNIQIPVLEILGGVSASPLALKVAKNISLSKNGIVPGKLYNKVKINWTEESIIDLHSLLQNAQAIQEKWQEGYCIILTGSTGFLGIHLLAELLRHPSIRVVHCIALRAKNASSALHRLTSEFKKYSLWNDGMSEAMHKVSPWIGGLELPDLGLNSDAIEKITCTADYIIHNAAEVNFLKAYRTLKKVNVASMSFLLKLQRMARNVPLAYTSTAGVHYLQAAATVHQEIPLSSEAPDRTDEQDGYIMSKWCAEQLLLQASLSVYRSRIRIHRPVELVGSTETKCSGPKGTVVQSLLRYYLVTGAIPTSRFDGRLPVFDLMPVNYVAHGIMSCMMKELQGRITSDKILYFHHCNPSALETDHMGQILGTIRGQALDQVSDETWIANAKARMDALNLQPNVLYMLECVIKGPTVPVKLSRSFLDETLDSEKDQVYKSFPITAQIIRELVLGPDWTD